MSIFNRQHYRVIARAIDESRADEQKNVIPALRIIKLLSFYFKLDNSKFNAEAFRKMCGEERD